MNPTFIWVMPPKSNTSKTTHDKKNISQIIVSLILGAGLHTIWYVMVRDGFYFNGIPYMKVGLFGICTTVNRSLTNSRFETSGQKFIIFN